MSISDGEIIAIPKKDIDIAITVKVKECIVECPVSWVEYTASTHEYYGGTKIDGEEYNFNIIIHTSPNVDSGTVKFDHI